MKAVLVRVGKSRNRWADEAVKDYSRRLGRRLPFSEKVLPTTPFRGDVAAVRRAEADRLLATCRSGDRLVVLDERGSQVTTETFASWITAAASASTRRLVFAIGGPYGHDQRTRDEAWRVLGLSTMVLNHEIARVVLVEQLYRASTLLWGGSYHH